MEQYTDRTVGINSPSFLFAPVSIRLARRVAKSKIQRPIDILSNRREEQKSSKSAGSLIGPGTTFFSFDLGVWFRKGNEFDQHSYSLQDMLFEL